jgi:hypothetical protein
MKNKILIIALVAVVLLLLFDRFYSDSAPIIPEYYKEEFKQSQKRINELEENSQKNRLLINTLKDEINIFDSIIYNADAKQLDSLFTDFFNATR